MNKSEKVDKVLEARAKARRAYFQGGPGLNDPKEQGYPGEIKYPRMEVPVGGDSREWEQQWFEGAAAETATKMGPQGTELELKKKLQRAKLSARFVKKANRKESFWEFSQDGKPLFRASVDDIFGREGQDIGDDSWNWVSSKEYAKFAMNEIRAQGIEAVAYALTGRGMTREGTVSLIKKQAGDKAHKAYILGRRLHRNWLIAEGKLKDALAADYAELQKILSEMKLVSQNVSLPALKQASTQNRHALYRLADEAFLDADDAMADAEKNVETAEATADAAAPEAVAPAGKPQDEAMPAGGMAYEDGGEKYPAPDARQVAEMHPILPAAHGDLPFQEIEQLQLKDLGTGPSGKLRTFDKAEWSDEALVSKDGVPTGDVQHFEDASGGGITHVEEGQDAPGLNSENPQWGFNNRPKDFAHLPHGGLDAAPAEAPVAEEGAEDADEEVVEEDEAEEAPEAEETEEVEEDAAEESEDSEEESEDEPKEAAASDKRSNRQKILQAALEQSASGSSDFAKYYGSNPDFAKYYGENKDFAKYYGMDAAAAAGSAGTRADAAQAHPDQPKDRATAYNEATGSAAPAAPEAPEAADEAIAASFNAKSLESLKKDAQVKMQRAYDMAADMQAKGWIGPKKEDLHKQAALFAQMDDNAFELFKKTCSNLKEVKASESKREKVQQIAGPQRQVIKTQASEEESVDLKKQLDMLDWS